MKRLFKFNRHGTAVLNQPHRQAFCSCSFCSCDMFNDNLSQMMCVGGWVGGQAACVCVHVCVCMCVSVLIVVQLVYPYISGIKVAVMSTPPLLRDLLFF